jgi:hypothetical protein
VCMKLRQLAISCSFKINSSPSKCKKEMTYKHINMVKTLADQLRSVNVNIIDENVYMVLLTNLPPSFDNSVISLESLSTKDVDFQFIVARLFHKVSKRKECESSETTRLANKIHKSNEKLCLYCKKPRHFVINCLKKKHDEKKRSIKLVKITNKCLLPH